MSAEILIEMRCIGSIVKVIALDTATLTEISFQAPANSDEANLHRIAAQKLMRRLEKDGLEIRQNAAASRNNSGIMA